MNDQERNYYNAFVRVRDFGVENNKAGWILAFLGSIIILAVFFFVKK